MLQPAMSSSCFCCTDRTDAKSKMDIDSALNELGMLSSVTQSRKDYMQEKQKSLSRHTTRERYTSDPGLPDDPGSVDTMTYKLSRTALLAETPPNSPAKPGYHIVQINRQFVTGVSTCEPFRSDKLPLLCPSTSESESSLSEYLGSNSLPLYPNYKSTSSFNPKPAYRNRRFRKPYDVPWRYNIEKFYMQRPVTKIISSPCSDMVPAVSKTAEKVTTSNSSTPEKNHNKSHLSSAQRSKSLDELDFAKLHMAESENFLQETKEVDNVSRYFKDLHVA